MVRRLRSFGFALFTLVFFQAAFALAQSYPDQAAEAHAWALYRAYDSGDSYTFEQQFQANPLLNKKAFIYVLTYMAQQMDVNPEAAESAQNFATELAAYIEAFQQDPVPTQIMTAIENSDGARFQQLSTAYYNQIYSQTASSVTTTTATKSNGPSYSSTTSTTATYAPGPVPFPATGGSDPAAREHAYKIYQATQAQDAATVQALLGNPDLTKKAFLSLVEHMLTTYQNNPNADITGTGEFAGHLAEVIELYLNDPVPAQIIREIVSGNNNADKTMLAYIAKLYPEGTSTAQAGEDKEYIYYGDNKEKASNY
ncbi:MAG: hypothetical protein KC800_27480, partial [Candidatus Eremiobacteraeota bacterium]|nr:hypothetical protein [Candidatus Eremiobacteraeota bacterium]